MKGLFNTIIIILSAIVLCGCEVNETLNVKESEDAAAIVIGEETPAIIIGEEEKQPAMIIDDRTSGTDNEGSDTVEADIIEEETIEEGTISIATREKDSVVIDFIGDICFDDGYSNMNRFRANGGTMSGVLSANILEELRAADITMANNEFPYTNSGEPLSGKTFTFKAKPSTVINLTEMGVDIVSLANNHAYDQGPQALLDTLEVIRNEGIAYVGAGMNIDEAAAPVYYRAGGVKIAFVSATQIERTNTPDTREATDNAPGVLRTLDPTRFLNTIAEAEENADFTIVYVHWGSENTYDVDASQKELARRYAEAGADLIIGDHSHCLQGFEYVEGVPVLYSLGNFWFNSKDIDTGIVQAKISDGRLEYVRFLPCRQMDCRTQMYEKEDSEYMRILGVMETLSFGISLDAEGKLIEGEGRGVPKAEPRAVVKPNYAQSEPIELPVNE